MINSNIEADLKTHHDVEIKESKSEIQRLRTEKITIQMDNEQLDNSLKCMEHTNKNFKSIYEERLNDKDKIINNLQDRIQNSKEVHGIMFHPVRKLTNLSPFLAQWLNMCRIAKLL